MPIMNLTVKIGRNPNQPSQIIAVFDANRRSYVVSVLESSPAALQGVSRVREGKAHCTLHFDAEGKIRVKNEIIENKTYVNGVEINDVAIDNNATLTLGAGGVKLAVAAVIAAIEKELNPPAPIEDTVDLAPMQAVWEEYSRRLKRINSGKEKVIILRSLATVMGILCALVLRATATGYLPGNEYTNFIGIAIGLVGLFLMVYSFICARKNKSEDNIGELDKWLKMNYVCPNCKKYIIKEGVWFIKQQYSKCPYCKKTFVDSSGAQ